MTSEEILIRISHLKAECESKTEEMKSLEKELKRISQREARRIMRERRKRADRLAAFIRHNSSRTLVVETTSYAFDDEGDLTEKPKHHLCVPGELTLHRSQDGEWWIEKEGEFSILLECVDNIYVMFE